jgi:hypothetical protein
MFFRPIRDKIESLRRVVWKIEHIRGAASRDVAELKRLMLARIAVLESEESSELSEASTSQITRRAA